MSLRIYAENELPADTEQCPPCVLAELAETEDYHWPFAILIPDVLTKFDLPDLVRELQSKQFSNIEPWGAKDGTA